MPNSNIKLIQILDNTSIDYQGKHFEGVLYVAKYAQATEFLRMQLKISELFTQICS